jgi:hypothetical protein
MAPPEIASELADLRRRVERLEQVKPNRGKTNQAGAARYLNRSEEWLRLLHARGAGPRRIQNGRFYLYSYDDLDRFIEETSTTA